jgi:hypothetical protein
VGNKHIYLFKRALVEEQVHPLAGGKLAFGVLLLDAALSPALPGALS